MQETPVLAGAEFLAESSPPICPKSSALDPAQSITFYTL
jgi:hypothetical protein